MTRIYQKGENISCAYCGKITNKIPALIKRAKKNFCSHTCSAKYYSNGSFNSMYGKHHLEKTKEKISKSRNGKKHSNKTKIKIGKALLGRKMSEKNKNLASKRMKERMKNASSYFSMYGKISKPQRNLFEIALKIFPDAILEYHIPNSTRWADIAVPSLLMDIEYDEPYFHNMRIEGDIIRDKELKDLGWSVMRFDRKWCKENIPQIFKGGLKLL